MKITAHMNLNDLAERMGSDATEADARAMRDLLIDSDHSDTDEISEAEWLRMIEEICK